jgi:hypothetical protein
MARARRSAFNKIFLNLAPAAGQCLQRHFVVAELPQVLKFALCPNAQLLDHAARRFAYSCLRGNGR